MKGARKMGKVGYWSFIINPGVSYSPNLVHNITISVRRKKRLHGHQPEKQKGFLVAHQLQAILKDGIWVLSPESLATLKSAIRTFKRPDYRDEEIPPFEEFQKVLENALNRSWEHKRR